MSGLLLIPVLDIEEEKRARHDHAQDGEGRQDAVQREGDLPQLLQDDGLVFRRFGPWKAKEKTSAEPRAQSASESVSAWMSLTVPPVYQLWAGHACRASGLWWLASQPSRELGPGLISFSK